MTPVVVVVPAYRDSMQGHPAPLSIQNALAAHLGARVTAEPHRGDLTITIHHPNPAHVAAALELYLDSAGIWYETRGAA